MLAAGSVGDGLSFFAVSVGEFSIVGREREEEGEDCLRAWWCLWRRATLTAVTLVVVGMMMVVAGCGNVWAMTSVFCR